MLALLQRVSEASVTVDQEEIARIGRGLLVLVGVERADEEDNAIKLCRKLLDYRVFDDEQGKMNLSLKDIEGELLLVSQFTLPADTKKGLRPSFSTAAPPDVGRVLFDRLVDEAKQSFGRVQTGRFGANMQVFLVNDGPVTFMLQC